MYLIEVPPRLDRRDRRSNSRIFVKTLCLNLKNMEFVKFNFKNSSFALIRGIRGEKF